MPALDVALVYKERKFAVLTNGWIVGFSSMYDIDGDETDDIEIAQHALVSAPDGTWITIKLDYFKSPLLQ